MSNAQNRTVTSYHTDSEIMRICAAFFVIMIHASGIDSLSAIVYSSVARFSVPVFIMLSGCYMLTRKPDGKRLTKKCTYLFVLMIVWSGIYFIYNLLTHVQSWTGCADLVRYLLTEPVHLWYIYTAITLYIFTPLFYIFHNNASQKEYLYALLITFFFGSWVIILVRADVISILPTILDQMKIPYMLGFVCLYLLGGYLHKYPIEQVSYRVWLYLAGLIGIAATIIGTWLLPKYGMPRDLLISFFAPNVILPAAAFFVFTKQFFQTHEIKSDQAKRIIHLFAQCSMGIYFLHPLILTILRTTIEPLFFSSVPCVLILQRTLIAWILSMLIVFFGKRIPILKWLF